MSNLEKDFRKEALRAVKALGAHLVNLEDELKNALMTVRDAETRKRLANLIKEKPYDLAWLKDGHYFAVELKLLSEPKSFVPESILEMPHQWNGLCDVWKQGGTSGMLVCFRFGLTDREMKKYNWNKRRMDLTVYLPTDIIKLDHKYTIEECLQVHQIISRDSEGILQFKEINARTKT